jgi:hypothetical protein
MVALVGAMVLVANPYTASAVKPVPPPAPAVPRIVDATGKLVGEVIGTDPKTLNPNIILNISGPSIIVQAAPDSFPSNVYLYFTSANCSGQPYFSAYIINRPHMFPIVGAVNNILYGPQANATPIAVTYSSRWDYTSGDCHVAGGAIPDGVIGDPIIDLSTQFTPPYRFVYP